MTLIPGADASLFNSTAVTKDYINTANTQCKRWIAVVESKEIPQALKSDAAKVVREVQNALNEITLFFEAINAG